VVLFSRVCAQPVQGRFDRYSVDDGLSQSSVYCIFQDSKGFMWFGTGDGINRFDGYQFETFKSRPGKKNGLTNSFITHKALEDVEGNIWVGTRMGGINKYLCKERRFVPVRTEFIRPYTDNKTYQAELIGFDSGKRLWLVIADNALACYEPKDSSTVYYDFPLSLMNTIENGPYRQGIILQDHIYFIGNQSLAVFSIKDKKYRILVHKKEVEKRSRYIASMCYDSVRKTIWMGLENGLLEYSFTTRNTTWYDMKRFSSNFSAYVIQTDRQQRIWIGTITEGLMCYDLKKDTAYAWQNIAHDTRSLSFNIVRTLYIDRSENLWIGTDGGGINKLNIKSKRFTTYANGQFIKCFYEDADNRLWYGTHENGFFILDRKRKNVQHVLRKTIYGNIVSQIAPDAYGALLIGSDNGLEYYKNGTYREIPMQPAIEKVRSNGIITHFLNTQEKTTLVATRIGLYEGRYRNFTLDTLKAIPDLHTWILRIYQTRDGRIWVSTEGNSWVFILRYKQGKLTVQQRILLSAGVRSFYEDTLHHTLWMGSSAGLIRYDLQKNTSTILGNQDGLANNFIYGLLHDDGGKIWLSTNKGISSYEPSSKTFRNYDVNDGLQSNEFNTGAFFRSETGELFMGGINGFNAFYPRQVYDNPHKPQVQLTLLRVNDEPLTYLPANNEILVLPYDSSTVAFEFAGLELTNPGKNQYRYQLVGWDRSWVSSGSKRFARYSNLPPGEYTFKVQACNNDKIWSRETTLLTLAVKPPFWKTWWFYSALILVIGLNMLGIIRFITQRKIKQKLQELEQQQAIQKERERISKDMHDDLGSGLSKIAIQSELLRYKLKQNDNPELHAERIVKTSRELVDNLSEIVWALNPRHDNPESLLAYIRTFTTDLFEDSSTICIFRFPEQHTLPHFPSEVRRNIFLIIKEALHNVCKYADASEMLIQISSHHDHILFEVRDNGKGFNTAERSVLGNGLYNMEKRAKAIGAELRLESAVMKGTSVQIKLPR
jgi:signal transduction histidine kinase/ligand-binding sensor domain-containing protein